MNKKNYIIAVSAVVVIAGLIFTSLNKKGVSNLPVVKAPPAKSTSTAITTSETSTPEQLIEKTGNFENSQLLEIAKQYVFKKPPLRNWNGGKTVDWNNYKELGTDFSKVTPEWIVTQKTNIRYIEPNKNPAPYDAWNDKYIVSWFFVPGCEDSQRKPNTSWVDKYGRFCDGGYNLDVVINTDGTVNRAELNALN
jgi:hypothetical protein